MAIFRKNLKLVTSLETKPHGFFNRNRKVWTFVWTLFSIYWNFSFNVGNFQNYYRCFQWKKFKIFTNYDDIFFIINDYFKNCYPPQPLPCYPHRYSPVDILITTSNILKLKKSIENTNLYIPHFCTKILNKSKHLAIPEISSCKICFCQRKRGFFHNISHHYFCLYWSKIKQWLKRYEKKRKNLHILLNITVVNAW